MLRRLTGVGLLALAACATATTSAVVTPIAPLGKAEGVTREALLALNSICGAEKSKASAPDIKLASGMGTGGFRVDTKSKPAQDWFDFGLALSHAFYHQDAIAAMRKSVEADPDCSQCQWGLAWSLGPTLNYGIDETQRVTALAAAEKARSLAKAGDDRATKLADAMVARYTDPKAAATGTNALGGPKAGGGSTEPAFGLAMKAISEAYPADTEIAVLAAHSLLIPVRGGNEAGLKPALKMLEAVLKDHPDDTGAIHYYIHATEFDNRAEDAIRYAEQLGPLAPAASHLVHMPAHTFFHAGRYEEAAVVNAQAIAADTEWQSEGGDPKGPKAAADELPMYYAHNVSFGLAGALMSGDAELALKYASHAAKAWPEGTTRRGNPVPRTYVALARYAPDQMLAMPESKSSNLQFPIYDHYARGEALLIKGDAAGAKAELKALSTVKAGAAPELKMARAVLEGRIAMAENRPRDAARLFEGAAKLQEKELAGYMDPPQWWYPVRRSLAAAYLKAGDFKRAEAEADKSLTTWKHDPLALWVKGKAQLAAGHLGAGEATLGEADDLWRGDFESITVEAI